MTEINGIVRTRLKAGIIFLLCEITQIDQIRYICSLTSLKLIHVFCVSLVRRDSNIFFICHNDFFYTFFLRRRSSFIFDIFFFFSYLRLSM